ncbi:MAG: MTH938/NDUFAF3 family protein [Chromatiales bacterium]|nr:MTH938/NDUFAF3 family protein [Chromatiales bacterium]
MKITLEQSGALYTLHSYREGVIRVRPPNGISNDDEALIIVNSSCLISGGTLSREWAPQSLAELSEAHLAPIVALQPEVILIGTGPQLLQPTAEQRVALIKLGRGYEVMDTAAACRTYNVLIAEGRRVVAALFVA